MDIVYASDDNYAEVMGVSLVSLLENNRNEPEITVYILDDQISDGNKRKLQQIFSSYDRKCVFLPIPDLNEASGVKINALRWSISAFSRLFLADLLPAALRRVLYLDCDTLVAGSLEQLWNQDLEGAVLGAVADCVSAGYREDIGLLPQDHYFNTGVLLIDLERWKACQIQSRSFQFMQQMNGEITYVDQGVLNHALHDKVKILPLEFNVYTVLYDFSYRDLMIYRKPPVFYAQSEVEHAVSHPVIVHFTSSFLSLRPWIAGSNHPYAGEWSRYKALSPWRDSPFRPDNRSALKKAYEKMYRHLPHSISVGVSGFLHSVLVPKLREKERKNK